MFDIGFMELMVVGILGLLVLGPERLPKAARTVGLMVGRVRRTMSNIQDDLERQARTEELRKKLEHPYATFLDEEDDNRMLPARNQSNDATSESQVSLPAASDATPDSPAPANDQKPS